MKNIFRSINKWLKKRKEYRERKENQDYWDNWLEDILSDYKLEQKRRYKK